MRVTRSSQEELTFGTSFRSTNDNRIVFLTGALVGCGVAEHVMEAFAASKLTRGSDVAALLCVFQEWCDMEKSGTVKSVI